MIGKDISQLEGSEYFTPIHEDVPDTLVRPLTKRDCARGFHDYRKVGKDRAKWYERCHTCGAVVSYSLFAQGDKQQEFDYQMDHKLDFLQPFGNMLKDYIEYYGEPKKIDPRIIKKR